MIKSQGLLVFMLLTGLAVWADASSTFPEVDSTLETRVHRIKHELGESSKSTDDFQARNVTAIVLSSDLAEFALQNFEVVFEARLYFNKILLEEHGGLIADTTSNLFQVGSRLGYAVGADLFTIDQMISRIEKLIPLFDHPALIEAARDLLNAWRDIADLIARKYPYLESMKELCRGDQ